MGGFRIAKCKKCKNAKMQKMQKCKNAKMQKMQIELFCRT